MSRARERERPSTLLAGLDRNMLESSVRESAVTLTENGYAVGYDFLTSNLLKN